MRELKSIKITFSIKPKYKWSIKNGESLLTITLPKKCNWDMNTDDDISHY